MESTATIQEGEARGPLLYQVATGALSPPELRRECVESAWIGNLSL